MNKRVTLKILCGAGVLLLMAANVGAFAADIAPPPDDSGWQFTVAPYLWAAGMEGKSGLFGFPPQDVNVSFGDVLQNLEFGFMGAGEARNGALSFTVDASYAKLGADIDTPFGIAASTIDLTAKSFMGTALAGYSVHYTDELTLDLVGGARLWSMDNEFDFNGGALAGTSASDGATWIDPMIGTKFHADVGNGVYVAGWGMIGGFDISSKFVWDVMGGAGYQFNEWSSVFLGYRAMGVDYRDHGFVYDVVQKGPVIGGVFKF